MEPLEKYVVLVKKLDTLKKCVDQNPKDVHHRYEIVGLVNQNKISRMKHVFVP